MGYIEGLLGGFTARKAEYETQMREDSAKSSEREGRIFEALLNSPDKETRDLATAGLLHSAQPTRRKGGLRGWLGELESSPYLQQIRDLSPEVEAEGGAPPMAGAPASGMVSTPPSPSLAQSPTAATQVGAPPLTAIEPAPRIDETLVAQVEGAPPAPRVDETLIADVGAEPEAPPSIGVQMGLPTTPAGPAGATLTGQAPAAQRMQPRQIFQTKEQEIIARFSAQEQGEIFGVAGAYEKAFVAQGVDPAEAKKRGLDLAIEERKRSRGMGGAGSVQAVPGEMPDGSPAYAVFDRTSGSPTYGKFVDADTGRPLEGFRPRTTTGSTSLGADRESKARELFNKPAARLTASEMAEVNKALLTFGGEKAGAVTTGRGEAAAAIPLNTQQRIQAATDLAGQWTKATADRDKMRQQYSLMQTGLSRVDADPIGGSQAVLVTFQKILDPPSVVRESEYARSSQGLAAKDWLQGMYDRYSKGGAGVPKPVLAEMVKTAQAFVTDENLKTGLDNIQARLHGTATRYEIEPRDVFGPDDMPTVGAPPPAAASAPRSAAPARTATPPPGAAVGLDSAAPGLFVDKDGNLIRR